MENEMYNVVTYTNRPHKIDLTHLNQEDTRTKMEFSLKLIEPENIYCLPNTLLKVTDYEGLRLKAEECFSLK